MKSISNVSNSNNFSIGFTLSKRLGQKFRSESLGNREIVSKSLLANNVKTY